MTFGNKLDYKLYTVFVVITSH